jgi:hypothetical protein
MLWPGLDAPTLEREGEKRTAINQARGAPPPRPRARGGGALLVLRLLQLQLLQVLQCY